jgi:tRNA(fMet)-specific endonuclease VapC
MLLYLFDTDHLSLFDLNHPLVAQRLAVQPPDTVGISAVTVEESLRGRLAALSRTKDGSARIQRYHFLLRTLEILHRIPRVAFNQASETQFQGLLTLKLRIGTQDTKIAAVALANNLTLLARNRRDFGRVPGLVLDDWSV